MEFPNQNRTSGNNGLHNTSDIGYITSLGQTNPTMDIYGLHGR